jgi:hypothetical protein
MPMKTTLLFSGLMAVSILISSCRERISDSGKVIVEMTDDSADYLEVNVEITKVSAHFSGDTTNPGGWMDLNTVSGVYDLLTLTNDVTVVLASGGNLPVGHISQLRLLLGQNNTLLLADSTIQPLEISSQDRTGLKILVNSTIQANTTTKIVLDFDAGKSVIEQGNGKFRLKPVIRVDSVVVL